MDSAENLNVNEPPADSDSRFDLKRIMHQFMQYNAEHQKSTQSYGKKDFLTNHHGNLIVFPMSLLLPDMEKFQARKGDVVIAGTAKSGASRFCAIIGCILHADDPQWFYNAPDLQEKVPWIDFCTALNEKGPRGIEQVDEMADPRAYWTRLNYDGLPESIKQKAKIVYHIRHPKDQLVTLYHHYIARNKYTKFEGQLDDLVNGLVNDEITTSPWFHHYITYWKHRNDENVYFASFEEFSAKPEESIRNLAKFLEKDLTDEQIRRIAYDCHFDRMSVNPHSNHTKNASVGEIDFNISKCMRRGEVGAWKDYLTPEQDEKINNWMIKNLQHPDMAETAKRYPATFAVEKMSSSKQ